MSTTKVMTALVTLKAVESSTRCWRFRKRPRGAGDETLPSARPDDLDRRFTLLSATSSANDAAVVLAEGIGGSVEHFAELRLFKARQIGATNTNFTIPMASRPPSIIPVRKIWPDLPLA
jgi:D-alanyl-D-alanine carboxypeptidase